MKPEKVQAEALHQEGMALEGDGKTEAALEKYRGALVLDFSRATTHYNVGLIHKYRCEWTESFQHNKHAVDLNPDDEASNWNLAIAATALGNWRVARSMWNRLGMPIELGEAPIEMNFGVTPVRLNPNDDGEVVWARRVDPVRTRILNIPFPSSGFRYGDVVLNDGAPVGYREYQGEEHPVFNVLALMKASPWSTLEAELYAPSSEDIDALEALCEEREVQVEDWTTSVRNLCKQCSEGRPHAEHDEANSEHWRDRHRVGFAATDEHAVRQVLKAWEAKGRRIEWFEKSLAGVALH